MKFGSAIVSSVKADLSKKEITISFKMDIHYLEEAEELAHYVGEDKGDVELVVTPRQTQMISTITKVVKEVEKRNAD